MAACMHRGVAALIGDAAYGAGALVVELADSFAALFELIGIGARRAWTNLIDASRKLLLVSEQCMGMRVAGLLLMPAGAGVSWARRRCAQRRACVALGRAFRSNS